MNTDSLLPDPANHEAADSINVVFMYGVPTVTFDNGMYR